MNTSINNNDFIVLPGDEFSFKEHNKRKKVLKITLLILAITFLLVCSSYVSVSVFLPVYWKSLWALIFVCPIVASLYRSIVKKEMFSFAFPFVCLVFYITLSFSYNIWGELAGIFAAIPVYYIIAYFVDTRKLTVK